MKLDSINFKAIPAQPDFLARIIQIDANSEHCFQEMDSLLRSDQGVVSLILRVANSAMYSRGKQIKTIPHAINLLGINVIRSLAVLSVSRSIFTQNKNMLIKQHVWQHSLLTALACQQICAEKGANKLSEEAFVAGLLHDIGKVLLFYNYPDEYIQTLDYALETPCSCAEAERKILGIDHYEVGKEAVGQWRLPTYFDLYIATDLDLLTCDAAQNKVMQILAIANNLIKYAGFGANSSDLHMRKEKLMNLGASDSLSDYLLEESFIQQLMQNEIYLLCV
ncbi:HD-like signal output (HDOD) domain, no enzymatic activity [Nitrosomonas sp. Nm51]|uniref:HDOD domain-containing protein n=1 Tax=Nitrosomonas sp. Nm51 TaxID=133720 RepID=UPI0008B1ACD8|nr:HDOD domain-containing protein [Nitrosomonas sp. Nm51]SER27756.1 HD-like signal output (HDOD) domain, no enzymatic activity [Nitrosomonas sp. Nm51]